MPIIVSIIICALITFLLWYGKFVYSRRNMYKCADSIPGIPHLPFIGIGHRFVKEGLFQLMLEVIEAHKQYGISKVWIGPKLTIALFDLPSIEIVLNTALDKDEEYKYSKSWIGEGLVAGKLKIWRKHRKMLSPTFNQKVLNGYIDIFAKQSDILVKNLSAKIGKGQFDVFEYITLSTLDSICETSMGVNLNAQSNKNQSFVEAEREQQIVIMNRMLKIWLKPQWLFNLTSYARSEKKNLKILHEFSDSIVQQKRLGYQNRDVNHSTNVTKLKASLELMMEMNEDGEKFSDREIKEEVNTLVSAGNNTVAKTSSNVLMMLGCLPHIQGKVIDELREIFGDSDRPVCKEDLPKMQYLERVIKETMRLWPLVPLISRKLLEDIKLEKYTLPAGAGCIIAIWYILRDKKIWGENAEEFDPDRFLPENSLNRHPYAFMPFSKGARDCIGKNYAMMLMKVLLSTVLRSYKIKSNDDYKNIKFKIDITLTAEKGYLISLESRNKL